MNKLLCLTGLAISLHANGENGCNGRTFAALTLPNGDVVFGGDFTECNGANFNHIVRYSPARDRWIPLGTRGRGTDAPVYSLVWHDGALTVGGAFTRAGDRKAYGIASWNPVTDQWRALASADGTYNGTNNTGAVIALESSATKLYVGGQFSQMLGIATPSRLAVIDAGAATLLGNDLGAVNTLYALRFFNGELYAGGAVMPSVNQLARFDGVSWQPVAFGVNGSVLRLAVFQNELIAAGTFTRTCANAPGSLLGCNGPGSINTGNVLRWSGTSMGLVNPITVASVQQGSLSSSGLSGLFSAPGRLIVGGLITGSLPSSSFFGMAFTTGTADAWHVPGTVQGSAIGGLFGYCNQGQSNSGYAPSFTESGGDLYVGGDFAGVGAPVEQLGNPLSVCPIGQPAGVRTRNIARLIGSPLEPQWQAVAGGVDDEFLFGDGLED